MYHKTVDRILALIKQNCVWHETFEHEAVRTSQEAANVRPGYTLEQGAKALIVRTKTMEGSKFFMLVLPAHQRLDTKKAKHFLSTKDLRFATEEEVEQTTDGVQIGGVPPFGNLFNLRVIADPTLFLNEKIVCSMPSCIKFSPESQSPITSMGSPTSSMVLFVCASAGTGKFCL